METAPILARLERYEGRVPHMYVCTGGRVTIGIGHAIATPEDAAGLSWTIEGRAAREAEIRADYARLSQAPKGLAASGYATLSRIRMTNAAIDELAKGDVARFATEVAASLPNWNKYPACVQTALFDMAFNLGIAGLMKFHRLLAACDCGDWEAAARQSHRVGIGESRDLETASLFRKALTKET